MGTQCGGAGTIFLKTGSTNIGQLIVDNAGCFGEDTPLSSLSNAIVNLKVGNGASVDTAVALTFQDLAIGSNGYFSTPVFNSTVIDATNTLDLSVLGNAQVDGEISATVVVPDFTNAPGAGQLDSSGDGSGAGYGGAGGASRFGAPGGGTYGSATQPTDFGSPGGSIFAGPDFTNTLSGAIRLKVLGTLTVNGGISAEAGSATITGGGDSGGSLWITARMLSGSGFLTANGSDGAPNLGGGGGGGRIAIYATTNSFSGSITAAGGHGVWPGQDGTIYIATNLVISGTITNTNGVPVAGVVVQTGGTNAAVTNTNGIYSINVPLFWTGAVKPSAGSSIFVPASRTYSALAGGVSHQDFLAAMPSAFDLTTGQSQGTNLTFQWYGIGGVTYQPLYSTNLVDWQPWGGPLPGSNAPITLTLPLTDAPQLFFRLSAGY